MKKMLLIASFATIIETSALAQSVDIIGGPDGAQTVHHCGMLKASEGSYTTAPVLIRIIQHKLGLLGYWHGTPNGVYGKSEMLAVKHFQTDSGLPVTGMVGPDTAQRLAYATHPSLNVHRCF